MSRTFNKSVPYKDFEEMNQEMLHQVNLTIQENPTGDSDKNHPTLVLVMMRLLLQKRN
jgi:hypothetical protein